jgi:hypothetical protein
LDERRGSPLNERMQRAPRGAQFDVGTEQQPRTMIKSPSRRAGFSARKALLTAREAEFASAARSDLLSI